MIEEKGPVIHMILSQTNYSYWIELERYVCLFALLVNNNNALIRVQVYYYIYIWL